MCLPSVTLFKLCADYIWFNDVHFCCRLENIYFRALVIVSGYMHNTEIAVDALSIWLVLLTYILSLSQLFALSSTSASSLMDNTYINYGISIFRFQCFVFCSMSIYAWESMIPLGFLAAVGYVVTGCKSLSELRK